MTRTLDEVAAAVLARAESRSTDMREAAESAARAIARTWPDRWTEYGAGLRLATELINLGWTPPRAGD